MCFRIILKVTINQGFALSLEDTIFEKSQGEVGGQVDPSSAVLGLRSKRWGRACRKVSFMIFMNFKSKLKMKISYTESFVNKILKSAPKVNSFKCLRLSQFMYGDIHLVENQCNAMFTLTKVTFYLNKSK